MLRPILDAYEKAGGSVDEVLHRVGLHDNTDQTEYLPSTLAWNALEFMAESLGDPHFCFRVGYQASAYDLPNLSILNETRQTLGESMIALIVDAPRMTNQAGYTLTCGAETATLAGNRTFKPLCPPTQSDAFFTGLIVRLIRDSIGWHWNPARFNARISGKSAIPDDVLPRASLIPSRNTSVIFRFPARWLMIGGGDRINRNAATAPTHSKDVVDNLQRELARRLDQPDPSLRQVSAAFSLSERSLQSVLKQAGTSFRTELICLRAERSKTLLTETDLNLSLIGRQVGLPLPSSFNRAFRSWTGFSPGLYRKRFRKRPA